MRAYIAGLIVADAQLIALGINVDSLISGDIDSPSARPFMVLRWGATVPGLSVVNKRLLTAWTHHDPGNASVIDAINLRLRTVLEAVAGVQTETGWITEVKWTGESDDLPDDGNDTITRQSNFTLVASGV
jgi:hypothetical protein